MKVAMEKRLDAFFGTLESAAAPLLMLDYDGTLAPFRVDRYQAWPWAGIRELLSAIQAQGRTRIVVITGRPAAEIPPLLSVEPSPEVWGLHGAERLHVNGKREFVEAPQPTRERLSDLRWQLRQDALGGLFEEKANAAVVHWRGVPASKAKLVERRTRELFEPLAQRYGLKLLEFEAGLELRAGPGKGDAVKALLEETNGFGAHAAAYLGDDLTDEEAFRAIKESGLHGSGLGVLIRRERRETVADIWLRPPEELRTFLMRWSKACGAAHAD